VVIDAMDEYQNITSTRWTRCSTGRRCHTQGSKRFDRLQDQWDAALPHGGHHKEYAVIRSRAGGVW
jgi:hypothetical protein